VDPEVEPERRFCEEEDSERVRAAWREEAKR
jgi:hypothetical protein